MDVTDAPDGSEHVSFLQVPQLARLRCSNPESQARFSSRTCDYANPTPHAGVSCPFCDRVNPASHACVSSLPLLLGSCQPNDSRSVPSPLFSLLRPCLAGHGSGNPTFSHLCLFPLYDRINPASHACVPSLPLLGSCPPNVSRSVSALLSLSLSCDHVLQGMGLGAAGALTVTEETAAVI